MEAEGAAGLNPPSKAIIAAKIPEGDGYLAAIINFRFIANAVWSTDETVALLGG